MNLNIKTIMDAAIFILLIFAGYVELSQNKCFIIDYSKFTKKSIESFVKPMVIMTWVFALVFLIMLVGELGIVNKQLSDICDRGSLVLAAIDVGAYFILSSKMLVKKTKPMGYKVGNKAGSKSGVKTGKKK